MYTPLGRRIGRGTYSRKAPPLHTISTAASSRNIYDVFVKEIVQVSTIDPGDRSPGRYNEYKKESTYIKTLCPRETRYAHDICGCALGTCIWPMREFTINRSGMRDTSVNMILNIHTYTL